MRAWSVLLGCALAVSGASSVRAESVDGTRSGELLTERKHEIRVKLDRTHAELRVRRTVHNGGERHDQALFFIDTPAGAAATSLATLGMANNRPTWFPGRLMEAEEAAAKYRELTGIGGYYPKDPALLSWRTPNLLALQVFPVAPGGDKTIEYTWQLPMTYEDGRYRLSLEEMGTEKLPAEIAVFPARRTDQIFVDDKPKGRGAVVTLDHAVDLALARRDPARIEGGLAVVPTGSERHLVHWSFEAASRLSTVPSGARVVVLIDTSRSQSDAALEAKVAAARAYLGHFKGKNAKADVITFDRTVTRRHGQLRPVAEVIAGLEGFTIARRNGSQIDDALATAAEALATAKGPRRVVLFTDALVRDELTDARVETLSKRTKALVHIAEVEDGGGTLERDDHHNWSFAATDTGGVAWEATIDADDLERTAKITEELARPLRIHNIEVTFAGIEFNPDLGETLDEGQGFEEFALFEDKLRHVTVTGELWAKPIREVQLPDTDEGRRWSALVFGDSLHEQLSEEEMMVLALHGGAVSPVTSYLAIEPGGPPLHRGPRLGLRSRRRRGVRRAGLQGRRLQKGRAEIAARSRKHPP